MSLSNQWCNKAPVDAEALVNNVFDPGTVDLYSLVSFLSIGQGFSCTAYLCSLFLLVFFIISVVVYNHWWSNVFKCTSTPQHFGGKYCPFLLTTLI